MLEPVDLPHRQYAFGCPACSAIMRVPARLVHGGTIGDGRRCPRCTTVWSVVPAGRPVRTSSAALTLRAEATPGSS